VTEGSLTVRQQRIIAFRRGLGQVVPTALVIGAALAIGAVVIWALETYGLNDASSTYLLAVVAVAVLRGTIPAVVTAIGAFLAYDFFFIAPTFTFTVRDPAEWLNLLLLLVVGVVVGRLAGRERDRAIAAVEGEREATAMFDISFTLATERDTASAFGPIAVRVREETRSSRVWITVGDALVADTGAGDTGPPPAPGVNVVLRRRPGETPAEWVRVHVPGKAGKSGGPPDQAVFKVAITASDQTYGAIWASRPRDLGDPDVGETRVLSAAADQVGGAIRRDRLQRDATSAEISRRSDALKSALLDSVSHDLRTPLASIRAAAGTLMDPEIDWPPDERREIAASIDREADWLNRLVTNLLDMSRVEAGELRPSLGAFQLADLVRQAIERSGVADRSRPVEIHIAEDLPPVLVDEVLMLQVLVNALDNSAKYAGPDAPIRISAEVTPERRVRITVEDGGPGVPDDALPRLFEKFYRVPRKGEGSRRGTGIGLAVVRGLVEAMGGTVIARRGALGGLALDIEVPIAVLERGEEPGP
jgi:two-component system, OmpR family, sensor histidine kinase KdpD